MFTEFVHIYSNACYGRLLRKFETMNEKYLIGFVYLYFLCNVCYTCFEKLLCYLLFLLNTQIIETLF